MQFILLLHKTISLVIFAIHTTFMLKFYITHDKHITQIVTSGETYMKIVICDDSIEDLLKIEKILLKYKNFIKY